MYKRTAVLFAVFTLGMMLCIFTVCRLSAGSNLATAAAHQQTYVVTAATVRGTIYDHNLDPLTGCGKTEYHAALVPEARSAAELSPLYSEDEMKSVYTLLKQGKPFTLNLPRSLSAPGMDVFPVRRRYAEKQTAVHVIGYLDGSGNGAAGIEKLFNGQLSTAKGKITVSYPVDAMDHVLSQSQRQVTDTTDSAKSGVVLTLDRSIQKLVEDSAAKHLQKGAVVVLEVPSGKIRAMASLPAFSPEKVADVLNSTDSPLLDRATSAYSVGSVFKLAAAAAALEYGISPEERYTCTGAIDVDGQLFHCFDSESHGKENMKQAVVNSCNAYFVHLMQKVPQDYFLRMTQMLGFGRSFSIAPGMSSDAGILPSRSSLNIPRALANFSFGQGELTATPLQVAAMANAIASGGTFTQPYLYEGLTDEKGKFTEKIDPQSAVRVMKQQTASLLRDFMKGSIESGTSRKGKPDYGTAGAKTATAQTGKFVNGTEQVESWFAGFYPYENPKYVIVIFAEGGDGGGTTCGPVFREIADGLYGYVS